MRSDRFVSRSTIRNIIIFALSYLMVTAVAVVTGYGITRIDLILPGAMVVLYMILNIADRRLRQRDKTYTFKRALGLEGLSATVLEKEVMYMLPLALLFSAGVTVGRHIDVWNQRISRFDETDIVYLMVLTAIVIFFMLVLFGKTSEYGYDGETCCITDTYDSSYEIYPARVFFLRAGILLLCWMPYYLTLFPGNLGRDTFESIDMCLGNIPWTNHHPIFFTALIDATIKATQFIGNLTVSMGIFTFLHMSVFACTLSYITGWIKARGRNGVLLGRLTMLFFALHPIMAMYSMYITKDTMFACAISVLVLKLLDMEDEPSVSDRAVFALSGIFVMLLRNNGMLIMVLLGITALFTRRMKMKNVVLTIVIPILIFIAFRTVAYNALDIAPQSFAESAAIPLQQTGYVIDTHTDRELTDSLSEEDSEILYSIMPYDRVRRIYELGYADSYKFDPEFDDEYFNEHKMDYLKTWAHLLPQYLPEYVLAYLAQTAGYWHYGETNTVATQGIWEENEVGIVRVDIIEKVTGVSLYGLIEKLMLGMRKAPILCILSSMAMEFYAVLLMMTFVLIRTDRSVCIVSDASNNRTNRKRILVAFMPLLFLWISIMIATPAFCLFRYMFPFFILWPVIMYYILFKETGKNMGFMVK